MKATRRRFLKIGAGTGIALLAAYLAWPHVEPSLRDLFPVIFPPLEREPEVSPSPPPESKPPEFEFPSLKDKWGDTYPLQPGDSIPPPPEELVFQKPESPVGRPAVREYSPYLAFSSINGVTLPVFATYEELQQRFSEVLTAFLEICNRVISTRRITPVVTNLGYAPSYHTIAEFAAWSASENRYVLLNRGSLTLQPAEEELLELNLSWEVPESMEHWRQGRYPTIFLRCYDPILDPPHRILDEFAHRKAWQIFGASATQPLPWE